MLARLGPTLWGYSNTRAIKGLRGLKMVNRQRGAGTRVLFGYLLGLEGIEPSEIPGYDHEVTTHLAIALAAKNKDVDFVIGVGSAVTKMGLDFIYLQDESHEFILKKENLKSEPIQKLIQMLESQVFRSAVNALGGYTTSQSGHMRYYER